MQPLLRNSDNARPPLAQQQESSLSAPTPEEKKANLFGLVVEFLGLLVAKLLR